MSVLGYTPSLLGCVDARDCELRVDVDTSIHCSDEQFNKCATDKRDRSGETKGMDWVDETKHILFRPATVGASKWSSSSQSTGRAVT